MFFLAPLRGLRKEEMPKHLPPAPAKLSGPACRSSSGVIFPAARMSAAPCSPATLFATARAAISRPAVFLFLPLLHRPPADFRLLLLPRLSPPPLSRLPVFAASSQSLLVRSGSPVPSPDCPFVLKIPGFHRRAS